MNPRLLILTAGYGEGHNAAARALALEWDARHGAGRACVADVFALAAPRLNAVLRRAYLGLINRAPQIWSAAYGWLDRSSLVPHLMGGLRAERRILADLIAREQPAAICATYPAYAFIFKSLAGGRPAGVPFFNVVTDSISINSLWWRAGADAWFLPNTDSCAPFRRAGIADDRLHIGGFPVPPFFADHAGRLVPPDLAAGGSPRVLYIINSGTSSAAATARRLLTATPWEITCTVGRDARLQEELSRLAAGRRAPATILGWTPEIPRLLMTHHVVISKAGGATTQEALAAGCPMIVNQIVPGQEEGNYELLRRYQVGALARTPAEVERTLQEAFADQGRIWRQWREALRPIARPEAARDIAAIILARIDAPAEAEPIPLPLRAAFAPA